MQEGTSIGLFTVVTIVGFGMMFGILLAFLPEVQEVAIQFMEKGVNSTPTP